MRELEIKATSGQISLNYHEVAEALNEAVAGYKTTVYTDDTIKEAKADRAYLRKQADEIERTRKAIKKEFLQPYEDFESKCKMLVAIINEGTNAIDVQVKAYETKLKEAKKELIKELYLECVPEAFRDVIPLERIYKPSWENVTASTKSIKEDILAIEKQTADDINAITSCTAPTDMPQVMDVYKVTHSLPSAMQELYRIQSIRQRILDEEREKAHQKELEEAKWTAMNPPVPDVTDDIVSSPQMPNMGGIPFDGISDATYCLRGTDEDFVALEKWMTERGMLWERI